MDLVPQLNQPDAEYDRRDCERCEQHAYEYRKRFVHLDPPPSSVRATVSAASAAASSLSCAYWSAVNAALAWPIVRLFVQVEAVYSLEARCPSRRARRKPRRPRGMA
jgi:hypothetical protein